MTWVKVVEAAADAEAAPGVAADADPVVWAGPVPPDRAATASARAAGIARHTWPACPATSKSAPSVAHRWSANADNRTPDPSAADGFPVDPGAWRRCVEKG